MTLLEWREEYATGFDSVDHEHKELIGLINDVFREMDGTAERDNLVALLGEINERISLHFALEERLMRDHRYAGYDEHKADHERLLDEIRDIMDDCEAGRGNAYGDALRDRLDRWFMRHFVTQDARLHETLGV